MTTPNDTNVACPICEKTQWEDLLVHRGPAICSGGQIVKNEIPLVKKMCTTCGFVHMFSSPLDKNLDDYYEKEYSAKLDALDSDFYNFSTDASFADTLNQFVLSGSFAATGKLLDIGCGKGFFEEAFTQKYPAWKVEGVDPNVRSIELASIRNPTVRFHTRKFDVKDYEKNSYDVVCLHTVLNRVPLRQFVSDAAALAKEGGTLSLEVVLFSEATFQLYFADHHNLFFREHLMALASGLHLELVRSDSTGNLLRAIFQKKKSQGSTKALNPADFKGIKEEVHAITHAWEELIADVEKLKVQRRKVSFYGAGTSLGILLSQTDFPKDLIVGVYDETPTKIGKTVYGHVVRPFDGSIKTADAIVLCSGASGIKIMKKKIGPFDSLVCLKDMSA